MVRFSYSRESTAHYERGRGRPNQFLKSFLAGQILSQTTEGPDRCRGGGRGGGNGGAKVESGTRWCSLSLASFFLFYEEELSGGNGGAL